MATVGALRALRVERGGAGAAVGAGAGAAAEAAKAISSFVFFFSVFTSEYISAAPAAAATPIPSRPFPVIRESVLERASPGLGEFESS